MGWGGGGDEGGYPMKYTKNHSVVTGFGVELSSRKYFMQCLRKQKKLSNLNLVEKVDFFCFEDRARFVSS